MSTETITEPDAPTEADRNWWAAESNGDDPGHDPDMPTADMPGVEPPSEDDDGANLDVRAAVSAWIDAHEGGWAAV